MEVSVCEEKAGRGRTRQNEAERGRTRQNEAGGDEGNGGEAEPTYIQQSFGWTFRKAVATTIIRKVGLVGLW